MLTKLVSSDSHLVEPGHLWQTYTDPKFRDRAPKVQRDEMDSDWFYCEGKKVFQPGGFATAAADRSFDATKPCRQEELYPGGFDPVFRLGDMDKDNIEREVLYPSIAMKFFAFEDLELKIACFEAYSTWLAEFCKDNPERYAGLACVAIEDVEGAISEMHRAKKAGMPGVMVALADDDPGFYVVPDRDPFWAAAQDLDMTINLHGVTSQRKIQPSKRPGPWERMQFGENDTMRTLGSMIFGGLFHRFPKLKVVSAENGCGWAAFFIESMDKSFQSAHVRKQPDFAPLIYDKGITPGDVYRRNIAMTFVNNRTDTDPLVVEYVGAENLMWSSDYPHYASTYPRSLDAAMTLMKELTPEQQEMMGYSNAKRLYWAD